MLPSLPQGFLFIWSQFHTLKFTPTQPETRTHKHTEILFKSPTQKIHKPPLFINAH